MHDPLERIESVKAGSLGGTATGFGYCLTIAADRFLGTGPTQSLVSLGLETAIAIVCGFLFGVTYRYVIRTDLNDHLNSGAVFAFGLVRGLAQVDVDEFELSQVWMDGLIVGKSVLLFAIARYLLDRALVAGWVLPFGQEGRSSLFNPIEISGNLPDNSAAIAKLD